jgi:hypothetical protein
VSGGARAFLAALTVSLAPSCLFAGTYAGSLPVSAGVYRLPFTNGTHVRVTSDHTTHPAVLNRVDLKATGGGDHTVVAAGDGWIRFIVDTNTASQCTAQPVCKNNYVWIEHANGEWTKYTHMKPNTVTGAGRFVNEYVTAGTSLGLQGDIGKADGPHVHFEVAVPNNPQSPINGSGFLKDDGDATTTTYDRQNRIPYFCNVGFVSDGDEFDNESCNANCPSSVLVFAGPADNHISLTQADQEVDTVANVPHVVAAGGGESLRAGDRVTLAPGFHAVTGSYFSASIGECDEPGDD